MMGPLRTTSQFTVILTHGRNILTGQTDGNIIVRLSTTSQFYGGTTVTRSRLAQTFNTLVASPLPPPVHSNTPTHGQSALRINAHKANSRTTKYLRANKPTTMQGQQDDRLRRSGHDRLPVEDALAAFAKVNNAEVNNHTDERSLSTAPPPSFVHCYDDDMDSQITDLQTVEYRTQGNMYPSAASIQELGGSTLHTTASLSALATRTRRGPMEVIASETMPNPRSPDRYGRPPVGPRPPRRQSSAKRRQAREMWKEQLEVDSELRTPKQCYQDVNANVPQHEMRRSRTSRKEQEEVLRKSIPDRPPLPEFVPNDTTGSERGSARWKEQVEDRIRALQQPSMSNTNAPPPPPEFVPNSNSRSSWKEYADEEVIKALQPHQMSNSNAPLPPPEFVPNSNNRSSWKELAEEEVIRALQPGLSKSTTPLPPPSFVSNNSSRESWKQLAEEEVIRTLQPGLSKSTTSLPPPDFVANNNSRASWKELAEKEIIRKLQPSLSKSTTSLPAPGFVANNNSRSSWKEQVDSEVQALHAVSSLPPPKFVPNNNTCQSSWKEQVESEIRALHNPQRELQEDQIDSELHTSRSAATSISPLTHSAHTQSVQSNDNSSGFNARLKQEIDLEIRALNGPKLSSDPGIHLELDNSFQSTVEMSSCCQSSNNQAVSASNFSSSRSSNYQTGVSVSNISEAPVEVVRSDSSGALELQEAQVNLTPVASPCWQQKKHMAGAVLILLALTVATGILLIAMSSKTSGDPDIDEAKPEVFSNEIDLSWVPNLTDSTILALDDPHSPQYLAYDWASRDPNWESYEDWRKQQRFAMSCVFFSIGGRKAEGHFFLFRMHHSTHECKWEHFDFCPEGDGVVRHIGSGKRTLKKPGHFPPELSMLPHLEVLEFLEPLQISDFVDLLPLDTLQSLPSLKELIISGSDMGGPIPSSLGLLTSLTHLDLGMNNLISTVPSELGLLSALNTLVLSSNHLSGRIPGEIGTIPSLAIVQVEGNELMEPSLPSDFCTEEHMSWDSLQTDWCSEAQECCEGS